MRTKVIPLNLDASLYYEKAVEALERNDLRRALRYFTRVAEIESDNPVNHCNVAGVLSEMGKFEESNEVLRYILDYIAPHLYECYFYMANNYAYLQQFEEAERNAIRYLHYAPNGMYAEDTRLLLEQLYYEMGRSSWNDELHDEEEFRCSEYNERARRLLEGGKFHEAIQLLQHAITQFPESMPLYNNLALTYFYAGMLDDALETIELVLLQDPNNLHGLCNLALFYKHMGKEEELAQIVQGLIRLYPLHTENVHKLATTLSLLQEHEACYRLFVTLYKHHGMNVPSIVHQIAVAAYNLRRYEEAEWWWRKLATLSDGEEWSKECLELLKAPSQVPLSYRYPPKTGDNVLDEARYLPLLKQVLEHLRKYWKSCYAPFLGEAEQRIVKLIQLPENTLKKVRKAEALAALLEYVVLSEIIDVSKSEIAQRYGISVATLNRYVESYEHILRT